MSKGKQDPIDVRFFEKVYMAIDGHWYWLGATPGAGYGRLWDKAQGRMRGAHEISYELHVGSIPAGKEIDHRCRIRSCVNPNHLRAVTHHVNVLAGTGPISINAHKTHCKRGHEFDEANTNVSLRGGHRKRQCRKCAEIRERSHRGVCRMCQTPFTGNRRTTVCGKTCLGSLRSINATGRKYV